MASLHCLTARELAARYAWKARVARRQVAEINRLRGYYSEAARTLLDLVGPRGGGAEREWRDNNNSATTTTRDEVTELLMWRGGGGPSESGETRGARAGGSGAARVDELCTYGRLEAGLQRIEIDAGVGADGWSAYLLRKAPVAAR